MESALTHLWNISKRISKKRDIYKKHFLEMNKEIEQLKREQTQTQINQTLNTIELWLTVGMLTLGIIRKSLEE